MKRITSFLFPTLLIVAFFLLKSQESKAQCSVKLISSTKDCAPATSTFLWKDNSGKKISSVIWDFGDASTSNDTSSIVAHVYQTGTYTAKITVTYKDGSTCSSNTSKLVMYSPPNAVIDDPVSYIQCFKKNYFCFSQSSTPGASKAPIVKYLWNFGDGDVSYLKSPCHTYLVRGKYYITLAVTDSNGCSTITTLKTTLTVLADLKPVFTYNSKLGCNSANIQFKTSSDTAGLLIKKFYWNFGDGSPLDSNNYNPSHTYGPGHYIPVLKIVNSLGCSGVDSGTINVQRFRIKLAFKDTICWADAVKNGINFFAEQQPNVTFWQWNFGDPNSQQQNIANFSWTANHKFVGGPGGSAGGPGHYKVKFVMINANPKCGNNGQLDTCVIIHIKGPMAMVNLPAPTFNPNNYVPARPMNKSVFKNIANSSSSCGQQSLAYSVFTKAASTTRHVTYKYCNATVLKSVYDTSKDCYGGHKMPYLSAITLKPTDSLVSIYTDSTESTKTWAKGNAIPSGNVYFPSSGTASFNNMNDSNLQTCSLPNLVRFTNNSIKYRLKNAIDDNTFLNVTNPTNSYKDTCTWKNYPMASDSLAYFWRFNDPGGSACTSTVSNKNWDCNFSTLAAPYHYYKGIKGFPASHCITVNLKVSDAVTNCTDSTEVLLKQGPPSAYWDRSVYCRMNWEMQSTGLAPKGLAGTSGPPLVGFQLGNQTHACSGSDYPYAIDLSQTLPTCGATNAWIIFDSAHVVKYRKCANNTDSVLNFGFLGDPLIGYAPGRNAYPAGGPLAYWQGIPWNGKYWYEQGDTGCKTIGLVLQNGACFDTAWYHDYICFNKLEPYFNIFSVDSDWACGSTGNFKKDGVDSISIANIYAPNDLNHPKAHCYGQYAYYVNNQTFVDDTRFINYGHICQRSAFAPVEGVRVRLFPENVNQKDITSFKYNIQRKPFYTDPTNKNTDWYYTMPFWPDSATLTPFTEWNDSIKQNDYKVYYIDTPYLYVLTNKSGGQIYRVLKGVPTKIVLKDFPLSKSEIDSLKATLTSSSGSPKAGHITVSLNDERGLSIPGGCGKSTTTIYASKIAIKGSTQVLNLKGFGAVDSLTLPYPGVYSINTVATNLQGCVASGKYQLIYGHFATFNAKNDSVVCLGAKINFNYYVRYWSTNCPPPAGGGVPPDGCLNGYDEDANGNIPLIIDFNPWDSTDPLAYRMAITGGTFKAPENLIYKNEQMVWNFGDDNIFYKVPTGSKVAHTYTKPGVYTVTMRTIDWRGCAVNTVRRNFIKVIQPVADFALLKQADTLNYCAPTFITLVDKSTVLGGSYKQKVIKNGIIVDSTFVVASIASHIWKPGDGTSLFRSSNNTVQIVYRKSGIYDISMQVITDNDCSASVTKPHFVKIIGPTPKFVPISPLSGCYPFTIRVKNFNTTGVNDNTWIFGDSGTSKQILITRPPKDSLVTLTYTAPRGRFRLHLRQGDTFHLNKVVLPECYADYPLPTDSIQYYVTIYPKSPIILSGTTKPGFGVPATYTAKSSYGEYKNYSWDYGNGFVVTNTTDSVKTITYTQAEYNAAPKDANGHAIFVIKVTGTNDQGCTQTSTLTVLCNNPSGIEPIKAPDKYVVSPNPFDNNIHIRFTKNQAGELHVRITDIQGKTVKTLAPAKTLIGNNELEIPVSELRPGTYILKLDDGILEETHQMIKD